MTKINIKATLVATMIFVIGALAGCKKDDSYPGFSFAVSSVDFEWSQTKEIAFNTNKIESFTTLVVPRGWTATRNGNKLSVTSPAQGANADLTGKISMTAIGDEGARIPASVDIAIKIAEEITDPANSYIVTVPDKRYKFNALRRGNETNASITGATDALRLWSTSQKAIINVTLENGYVYFATGVESVFEDANAVLAVIDKDGNALWSWHIWASTTDPTAEPDFVGRWQVMNRNLGAFTNSNASGEEAADSYGLYYQWGRKDPFVGPALWDGNTPRQLFNNSNVAVTHAFTSGTKDDLTIGTVEWAVAHPNTFIGGYEPTGYDWLVTPRTDLWSTTAKTLYDPCPHGWRVAPPDIWADHTTTGQASTNPAEFSVEGDYDYGWTFVVDDGLQYHPPLDPDVLPPDHFSRVFYPAAGRRSFSPRLATLADNFTNVVNDADGVGFPVGFYWSSAHPVPLDTAIYPAGKTSALAFRHDYVNLKLKIT